MRESDELTVLNARRAQIIDMWEVRSMDSDGIIDMLSNDKFIKKKYKKDEVSKYVMSVLIDITK